MGITRYAKKGTKQVIKWKLKLPSGAHFILFCCRYEYIATADRVYFALERFLVKNNKCVFAYAIYRVHNNRRRRKQSETIKKTEKNGFIISKVLRVHFKLLWFRLSDCIWQNCIDTHFFFFIVCLAQTNGAVILVWIFHFGMNCEKKPKKNKVILCLLTKCMLLHGMCVCARKNT